MKSIPRTAGRRRGFTLIEVLIVVVILGILAATVLPQFTDADTEARESALQQNLQILRSQIALYSFQHIGDFPGEGSTDPQDFLDALSKRSNRNGQTTDDPTAANFPLGPYLVGSFPPNPYNNGIGVKVVTSGTWPAADEDLEENGERIGWFYNSTSGQIRANVTGTTSQGVLLEDL